MWMAFLNHPSAFCRPFGDFTKTLQADKIYFYSDASGAIGYGVICANSWMFGFWDKTFLRDKQPSIEFLELFALTVGIVQWLDRFKNCRIAIYCDNQSVVCMINHMVSSCKHCMNLLRIVMLECMCKGVRLFALFVPTKRNEAADALSRDN